MRPETLAAARAFVKAENIMATDADIEKNLIEILTVIDGRKKCNCCMGIDHCRSLIGTHGFEMVLLRGKNGWFSVGYEPCKMSGKKTVSREAERPSVQSTALF